MNPFTAIGAAVVIGLFAGILGYAIGAANTQKQVRVEERERIVTVKEPAMVVTCKSSKPSSPTSKSSSPSLGVSALTLDEPSEMVLTVEVPEASSRLPTRDLVAAPTGLPAWRVSALLGFDFRAGLVTGGASVEHHLAGPFYGGAWGLSHGALGVSIGASF